MPKTLPSPETFTTERTDRPPLYRVVLLDDDDHTYDYVIEMLQKIFIFTLEEAFRHAEEVDSCGRTVLITCELPQAEFARVPPLDARCFHDTPPVFVTHRE